uniref:Fibronectin type-III domain-containing protein n=1 Tax=Callorhinchus milii TaxID=7868 RepID=A0A4W3K407_CALMI
ESVQQLTVQSVSAQSVHVAWRGVRGATGYRLVWSPLTGQNTLKVDVDQNTKSYGIQGLQPNTDYGITVTALYRAVEGPSATARVKTVGGLHAVRERKREPALDVAEDLNLRILAISPTVIRLSWFIQRDVIGYRIEWRKTSEERAQGQRVLLSAATNTYDLTSLVPGTQYTITLYTLYTGREVATPAITSETVDKEIVLGRVTNLRAIQIGGNQIRLEWTGVSRATEYKIIWRNAEGYEITRLVSKDVTTFVIDRLQQGGPYLIKVLPLFGSREGSSTSISVRTDISVGQVSDLRILETRSNWIRITWIRAPEATGYRITWKLADGREESRVVSSSINTFDIKPLQSDTMYLIGVAAMVGNQEGRLITVPVRTGLPPEGVNNLRVTNLRVTETGFTRIRIEWDRIPRATGYRLKWRGSDGSVGNKAVSSNIALSDIDGLQPDTVYTVEISAMVDNNEGNPTRTTIRTAVGGVTNLQMVEVRGSHVRISWTGVGRVSGYRITWRRPDGGWNILLTMCLADQV